MYMCICIHKYAHLYMYVCVPTYGHVDQDFFQPTKLGEPA